MDKPSYVVNVDVAVHRDGEYLFVERAVGESHAAGVLSFPGGTVEQEPGDDRAVEGTAVREVEEEEVGVAIEDVRYVHSSTFAADDGTPCLNVVTRASYVGGDARPCAIDEIAAVHWLTPEAAADRERLPEYTEGYLDLVEADREAE